MNGAGQAATASAAYGSATITLIVALVIWVLYIVAFWKVFTKMGEPGWKCIIPFYNQYVLYKRTWSTKMFWSLVISVVLTVVFGVMAVTMTPSGTVIAVDPTLSMLSYVGQFAVAIIEIISLYFLSKSFGHGVGYFIGMVFLMPIFVLILGLGSSEYIGPKGEAGLRY